MTTWRKSSYSGSGNQSDCVELADLGPRQIGVRDSKAPEAGHLALGLHSFASLLRGIKAGKLDL
ncbi:DUF397 domain-containing protein [Actinomadura viridis]|uniref:DUF397 domain-containing protein n=1 Tax=Actinomadura viridis TaxID=58110 RepID=A0A931DSK4_9ACTN|nr:DUF397 domain-containing protein [Actinomadura viridis]MBG6093984.1 hypothetical protein [Actinomadura viridis]